MTLPGRDERVKWIIGSKSTDEVREKYDAWAGEYDADLAVYGYRTPALAAGLVGRHIPKGAGPFLDAGAGTGNMGQILKLMGYRDITAADLSEGMLEVAASTGAYSATRQIVLGEHLDWPDDHFEGVVCLGTFVGAHAPASSFDELVRITKPGGRLVFTVRDDVIDEFRKAMDAHEQAGRWKLLEEGAHYVTVPRSDEPETATTMFAYEVS